MESKFTCITCRVAFTGAEIQRQHYKTDWHRYNLKRKVAELPPVHAEEFQRRVLLQRELDETAAKGEHVYCKVCHKTFTSSKSFENHLKSKKHLSLVSIGLSNGMDSVEDVGSPSIGSSKSIQSRPTLSQRTSESSVSEGEDSDIEEVDSDEWDEEFSDKNPILNNNCLFCNHHSATMTKCLKHMTLEHSFFIPEIEYVTDIKGLLCYLGEKVVSGYMCLWCNDHGKTFYSAESAQQHMVDKGHCKMLHEGEALLEYAEYYDYSKSYPDYALVKDSENDEEATVAIIEDEDYQLVLPSGAVIGHRSLMRYFKQKFDPNRVVAPVQKKVHRVLAQYRALGYNESNKEAVARKVRDMSFMQRVQTKYNMKLGMKANNLSIKRPQVNF